MRAGTPPLPQSAAPCVRHATRPSLSSTMVVGIAVTLKPSAMPLVSMKTGKLPPAADRKGRTGSAVSSMETGRMATVGSDRSAEANLANSGNSARQGGHQVAQKWSTTTRPLRDARSTASGGFSRLVTARSGAAGRPLAGGTPAAPPPLLARYAKRSTAASAMTVQKAVMDPLLPAPSRAGAPMGTSLAGHYEGDAGPGASRRTPPRPAPSPGDPGRP